MADEPLPYAGPLITRAEARARGLKRYFTGKPCKYGHLSQRQISSLKCVTCGLSEAKAYRLRNLEIVKAKDRAGIRKFQAELRDIKPAKPLPSGTIISRGAAKKQDLRRYFTGRLCKHGHIADRQTSNATCIKCVRDKYSPSKAAAKRRAHYEIHRMEILERANAAGKTPRGRLRKRLSESKRRAKLIEGSISPDDITSILRRQKQKCANPRCRTSLSKKTGYHLDHIQPLSRGGAHDRRNIQALCPTCNMSKHAKDPLIWARENGLLL